MTCREKEQNRLATEITSTERNSIGYADVQIKSARNGRRDSLIKSREQDTYNSASKVPKATPCGQSPMGTPNAQNTYDNTPVYPSRNYAREMHNKARLGQHPKARYTTSISCAQI